jgi:hypothetical protein
MPPTSKLLARLLGVAAIFAATAVAAAPAEARTHVYCFNTLAYTAGCPPTGSSEWLHLGSNYAHDPYGSHYTCIDDYLDPNNNGHYTNQICTYSSVEYYVVNEWGYPRTWNGEGTSHVIEAKEEGT